MVFVKQILDQLFLLPERPKVNEELFNIALDMAQETDFADIKRDAFKAGLQGNDAFKELQSKVKGVSNSQLDLLAAYFEQISHFRDTVMQTFTMLEKAWNKNFKDKPFCADDLIPNAVELIPEEMKKKLPECMSKLDIISESEAFGSNIFNYSVTVVLSAMFYIVNKSSQKIVLSIDEQKDEQEEKKKMQPVIADYRHLLCDFKIKKGLLLDDYDVKNFAIDDLSNLLLKLNNEFNEENVTPANSEKRSSIFSLYFKSKNFSESQLNLQKSFLLVLKNLTPDERNSEAILMAIEEIKNQKNNIISSDKKFTKQVNELMTSASKIAAKTPLTNLP